MTVFSNWPKQNSTLGNVLHVAFSPSSGYIAFGNNKFSAKLFRYKLIFIRLVPDMYIY